jgi:hypothetical protein
LKLFIEALRHADNTESDREENIKQIFDNCLKETMDMECISPKNTVNMIESNIYRSQNREFCCWCHRTIVFILMWAGERELLRTIEIKNGIWVCNTTAIGAALGYLRECHSVMKEDQMINQEQKAKLDRLLCQAKATQQLNTGNTGILYQRKLRI